MFAAMAPLSPINTMIRNAGRLRGAKDPLKASLRSLTPVAFRLPPRLHGTALSSRMGRMVPISLLNNISPLMKGFTYHGVPTRFRNIIVIRIPLR
jgi:ABC-type molybdate transport system permease subunit